MNVRKTVSQERRGTGGLKRRKGIYLLPNLFTTAALFAGFFAMVAAIDNKFQAAAIAIYVAMVLDGLDGRVARLTNTQTDFGKEFDSLADMVSFGLAPGLVVYIWAFSGMQEMGWYWFQLGWLAAFLYTACAALRLARFNTRAGSPEDKRFFRGLPSPSGAAVVAGTVWVFDSAGVAGSSVALPTLLITVVAGILMVSNLSYYSFRDIKLTERVPFTYILGVVLVFTLIAVNPPLVLYTLFGLYVLSGPMLAGYRGWRKYRDRRTAS